MIRRLKIRFFPKSFIRRFNSPFAKRVFLLKQYEMTVKRIWGNEFARDELKVAHEVLRREYDKLNETLDAAMIAKDKNVGEARDKLDGMVVEKTKEIEEWKKKLDLSQETIDDLTNGIQGYRENLDALKKRIKNQ